MAKTKERLDKWLVASGLVETRERARSLILEGKVRVAGKRADKPGTWVAPEALVTLSGPDHPYVSRGGVKLEGALRAFGVDPTGKVAMDVGASTGGFSHCLLLHGAIRVYAVDVGYGQFDWGLRNDPRVVLFERTNIRKFEAGQVPEKMDLITVDVSFISLRKVIPGLAPFLHAGGQMLCLIKPQFEVGRDRVGKGGVVRDPQWVQEVLETMEAFALDQGFHVDGIEESVLKGPKGNREFFLHLRNEAAGPEFTH